MSQCFATAYLKVAQEEEETGGEGFLRLPLPGQVCEPDLFSELFLSFHPNCHLYSTTISRAASTTEEEEGEIKEEKVEVKEETGKIVL